MREHAHNWSWAPYWEDGPDRMLFICIVKGCDETLSLVEVEDRLNRDQRTIYTPRPLLYHHV